MSKITVIPKPTIQRLPLYLRYLTQLEQKGIEVTSSEELGRELGVTSVQIRKDLAYFGEFGRRGVGYEVNELLFQVKEILGLNRRWELALAGAGHLGYALANYPGFNRQGFTIAAIFDNDPQKIGQTIGELPILDVAEMVGVIRAMDIKLGVITVPAGAAQEVAEKMIEGGVKGIWNFAPVRLKVPADIDVINENLSVGLLGLSYYLSRKLL